MFKLYVEPSRALDFNVAESCLLFAIAFFKPGMFRLQMFWEKFTIEKSRLLQISVFQNRLSQPLDNNI